MYSPEGESMAQSPIARLFQLLSFPIPTSDFWYSTTFWIYVFWGLWYVYVAQ